MKPMRMSLIQRINAWKGMYLTACEIMERQRNNIKKLEMDNYNLNNSNNELMRKTVKSNKFSSSALKHLT